MTREEYINEVLNLVKSKYAKSEIEQELNCHIDDRIEYYTDAGYDYDYALYKAMEYMGEPDQVGARMNSIHNETPLLVASVLFQICFVFMQFIMLLSIRYQRFVVGFELNYNIVIQFILLLILVLFTVNYYLCSRHNFNKPTFMLGIEGLVFNAVFTARDVFYAIFDVNSIDFDSMTMYEKICEIEIEVISFYILIASVVCFCYASYQKAKLSQRVHSTVGLRYYGINKINAFACVLALGITVFVCVG